MFDMWLSEIVNEQYLPSLPFRLIKSDMLQLVEEIFDSISAN